MKKLICVVALLVLPSMASAQLPEPIEGLLNPLVVAGANYLNDEPADGSNRVRFFLTANVAGIKPFSGVPLYVGGIGIDIRTLPELGGIGESNGAGLSIPGLTYAFSGNQAVVQVGYSMAFNESAASGIYFGFGFALTPPQAGPSSFKAKREAKAKAKAKTASHDASDNAVGPPAPGM